MTPTSPLRHQLASDSPVRLRHIAAAVAAAARPGPGQVESVETLLCRLYGVHTARACGSGTEALVLALQSAEALLGRRPTVALPAFSCFDLASAAVHFGAPVLFYDVDAHTLGPNPASLRQALEDGADVVVVAPLYGIPTDWETVAPILADFDAVTIEDAAQGSGARWHGTLLGGFTRLGVLSFGRGKGWTAGSGGALLIQRADDAEELDRSGPAATASAKGWGVIMKSLAHWGLGRPTLYGLPRKLPGIRLGETVYHPARSPEGLTSAGASLLLMSRDAAEREAHGRRTLVSRYYQAGSLDAAGISRITVPERSQAGYIRYPILLPAGMKSFADPDRAVVLGVAPSYPRPLPALTVLAGQRRRSQEVSYGGAQRLANCLVTLPTHGRMTPAECTEIVELLSRGD